MTAPTPTARSSDADVIAESRDRPDRFGVIFDRYFADVHRYIERRLGTDLADDVASDTFLAAFDKRHRYDLSRPDARPWLYGIATNLIGKHRRRQTAQFRAYKQAAMAAVDDDHADEVTARLSAQLSRAALAEALAKLSAGERDVLLLLALAELTHQEIAEALGISYGTVGSRLSRARAKLSRRLRRTSNLAP
ncbi:RNA polymerase sigma factor [Actinomadura roseirufa]|uniref:RNA polymerase sigma factor n=1 Tax=Actinomadura roseirufa TaxID=2094049 RepID=UPI001040F957|nr:RNA polymerase sigma factor [Actinomadura roseirufa]